MGSGGAYRQALTAGLTRQTWPSSEEAVASKARAAPRLIIWLPLAAS